MKVSFDGMRINATRNMNKLWDVINTTLIENAHQQIDDDLRDELVRSFNNAAMSVDMFNCVFDNDCEDDINDLSESLMIKILED